MIIIIPLGGVGQRFSGYSFLENLRFITSSLLVSMFPF
jgi:hypothetical protein